MIDLREIVVANGITIMMMCFLVIIRRKNRESLHVEDKLYDGMVWLNLLGAVIETVSFWVDGKSIPGGRWINYISNSFCYVAMASIGLFWCLYVEIRVYQNQKRTRPRVKLLMLPWLVELAAFVCNLFGTGIMFCVSRDNVYQRSPGIALGYITLLIYFSYSIYLVWHTRNQEMNLHFFPVHYFVGPCLAGTIAQFLSKGITTSCISVAVALTFVQMQTYAGNLYRDELSGLFSRRYLKGVLEKRENRYRKSLYGIMMDIDDFKSINDNFGHNIGDQAISKMGELLFQSIPSGAIAIRYAGDEFVVLLPCIGEQEVLAAMEEINGNLDKFNQSGEASFQLRVSMGYTKFQMSDNSESFLKKMDEKMYEQKRRHHQMRRINPKKTEVISDDI